MASIATIGDYKKIPWNLIVPLDSPGGTLDRSIQTLYLDDFDLFQKKRIERPEDPVAAMRVAGSIMSNDLARPLFIHCDFDGRGDPLPRLAQAFTSDIKPAFPQAGFLVFSSKPQARSTDLAAVHVPSANLEEFQKKVARHLEILVAEQPKGSSLNPAHQPFSPRTLEFESIDDITVIKDEAFTLKVNVRGIPFEMYCLFKSKNPTLTILGQAAINRTKTELPCFFRWKWLEDIPSSGIVLNDPTLYLSDHLNGGWFAGSTHRDYIHDCVEIINKIISITDCDLPPIFFGSSAGGFTSMGFAACIPDAVAIVDIPQTDLRTYHARGEIDRLALASFGVNKTADIPIHLHHRIDSIKRFEHEGRIPEIIYLHNIRDTSHISQLNHFMTEWSTLAHKLPSRCVAPLHLKVYDRYHITKGGHVPLSKRETIDHIASAIDSLSSRALKQRPAN